MARRLALFLAVVATAPLWLAAQGASAFTDSLVFVWLFAPLAGVALLFATGNLIAAEAVSALGLIVAGVAAALSGGVGRGALAWLVLAPVDALFSLNIALVAVSGALAGLAAAGVAAADAFHLSDSASGLAAQALFAIPVIFYAASVAFVFVRLQAGRSRAEPPRADPFAILTETFGDLVVTHDRTGAATSISTNCQALFGLRPKELMGRGFFERIHVADRPAFLRAIASACEGGGANATLRLRTSGLVDRGAYSEPVFLWLDMRARRCRQVPSTPAHAQKGDVAIAIFRDITETKWRQDELETARARAEEASVSKDHFLANMSHELRTPLNAIIGFSEILGDAEQTPPDPAKQREYAAIIHHSGLHLLSVVNSILDLSKIQSGSFDLTPSRFSIGPLLDMCCDMIKLKAEERNIDLRRSCPDGLDEIMGDKRACKQILINLLSNAVKFTPDHGTVSIGVQIEGDALLILVADSGVGINAQDLLRLGSPFFQAQGALDRPFEGTGLGLSIVRGLVGLHGGSIAVASEPDEGTCVQVRLPMDCRAAAERGGSCAKIETIAGYRQGDEQRDLFQQITVKKIA
jgi:cell cycle sensor histidine kinase DivJ